MNIKDFLTRFESACNAMGLGNDAEKCNLFGSYLRGRATAMWMNAQYEGVNVNDWRSVKEHFIIRYRGKQKPLHSAISFQNLFKIKLKLSVTLSKDALRR